MNETKESLPYTEPSILNTLSYGLGGFWYTLAYGVFNLYLLYFYETVLELNIIYVFWAMLIFTVWDAVNDPLIGFLTDRTTRFTRKVGKRFIWIVIGLLPANFALVLVYMPPPGSASTEPFLFFGWLVFTTCLFDSLTTLCFVNVDALFPDKFQTDRSRRRARGWGTPLSILALPIANIIPPLLLGLFGGQDLEGAYLPMILLMVATIAPISLLIIPGMRENKEMIERYYVSKVKRESFISALKSSLKQKSFVYYVVLNFGFQIVIGSLTASIPYAVDYVLPEAPLGIPVNTIILFATFLNAAIISVPFWIWVAKKIRNNKKTALIGGYSLTIGVLLTAFYINIFDSIIYQTILGFTMGNFWALMTIYFSDVLDERMTITKIPNRGATVGISAFFTRLSRAVQIAVFTIIHIVTGFDETSSTQILSAQIGIRFHMSVIPAIIMFICTLIYWKFYPITPEIWMQNKQKLKELGF
jgi:glycoside/pentoside/hexuronide:cation symporter, GPH family